MSTSESGDLREFWEELATLRPRAEKAEAEVERLHSWDGLMELLDEHWPEDVYPTLPDSDERDPGPRIVSALRVQDQLRATLTKVRELHPPVPIYVPCPDEGCERPDCVEVGLLTFVHTSEKVGTDCAECHDEDGGEVEWPCATLEAIDAILDADGGRDE